MKYSLLRLIKNLLFLMKSDLSLNEDLFNGNSYDYIKSICRYEVMDTDISQEQYMLNIYDYEETVKLLLENPKSFCRLGDGEIDLIEGRDIPFQKYDEKLAKILIDILEDDSDDFYVGINYNYFHSLERLNDTNRKFYLRKASYYRRFLLKFCNRNRKYIAAAFNQLYAFFDDYDYHNYYENIKQLFKGRELVIFCGENVLKNLEFDVFEYAKSKDIIWGPDKDAYINYNQILETARRFSADKTFIFILGPCSKALVYELSRNGYLAWDVGHLAKDYDMYMKKTVKNEKNIVEFYKPD